MIRSKAFFILTLMFLFLIVGSLFVSGFQGSSTSYSSDNKVDSFSEDNANSASFTQRVIGGIQTVGQYVTSTFNGRFGILTIRQNLAVNITYPSNGQIIPRGSDTVNGEDDESLIPNSINFTAQVFIDGTTTGFSGATCYFYDNVSLIGSSSTNSSGHCTMNFTKDSVSPGVKNITVNYSFTTSDVAVVSSSNINISITKYLAGLTKGNFRTSGCASGVSFCYYSGDNATLEINITETNNTGVFQYDPQNISANGTDAANNLHTRGYSYYPGGNISRTSQGRFLTNTTVIYGAGTGAFLKWSVLASDNNYSELISTAIHADVALCQGDFGGWSAWSACVSGTQTRSRVDSSSCTEVQTQSCTSGTTTGGDGGGSDGPTCVPSWGAWSVWGACSGGEERRTRSDGCGNTETEIRPCGCIPNWQCSGWSTCTAGSGVSGGSQLGLSADFVPVFEYAVVSGPMSEFNAERLEFQELKGFRDESLVEDSMNYFDSLFSRAKGITGRAIIESVCGSAKDVGNKQCHPSRQTVLQECIERSRLWRTSYIWKNDRCERGMVCSGAGECSCSVFNSCEFEGAARCYTTNAYQVCQADPQGCLRWSNSQRCDKGNVCSEGECFSGNALNSDVCEIGERTCLNNRPKICEANKKGVNDWKNYDTCAGGEVCFKGQCTLNTCFNGRQDSDERGVDCGGSCNNACSPPKPVCGNGVVEEGELCDDGNIENGDGCSSQCGVEEIIIIESPEDPVIDDPETINNETVVLPQDHIINETEIPLQPGQILVSVGEVREISINKGDQLSVSFDEKRGNKAVIKINKVSTLQSIPEIEIHTIRIDEIMDDKIVVTISSDPVTAEIPRGGSETFSFSLPPTSGGSGGGSGGGGGSGNLQISSSGTQNRTCTDLNLCGVQSGKPPETQSCIVGLNVIFSPQNLFLNLANGTNVNFNIQVPDSLGSNVEIRWYLDSVYKSGNSGIGNVQSAYSNTFYQDSKVRADIIIGTSSESREWQITINKNVIPNCNENWYCQYSKCDGSFKYAQNCQDLNSCGSDLEKPTKKECSCMPEYKCEEWSECNAEYDVENVLQGDSLVRGIEERTCEELTNCIDEEDFILEEQECSVAVPIRVERTEWCYEEYIEIYDVSTNQLVSRVKERSVENIKRVDIGFLTTEAEGICSYCFDNVQNYDERGVDCGGQVCQKCIPIGSFFDYLYFSKFALWILLLMLTMYSAYRYRYELVEIPKEAIWRIRAPRIRAPEVHVPRMHLPRFRLPHIHIEFGEGKAKPRRVVEEKVREVRKPLFSFERIKTKVRPRIPNPYAGLKRQLAKWKRKGYYETTALESSLSSVANRMRYETRLAKERRELERENKIRERELARERERANRERVKEARLREKEVARRERERAREERKAKRRKFFASFFSSLKRKRDERNRLREINKRHREIEKAERKREKEIIRERKKRAKELKTHERKLARERKIESKKKKHKGLGFFARLEKRFEERRHKRELVRARKNSEHNRRRIEREHKRELRKREKERRKENRKERRKKLFAGIFGSKKVHHVEHREHVIKGKGWFARMRENSRRKKLERERRREQERRERERIHEERRREYERRLEERKRAKEMKRKSGRSWFSFGNPEKKKDKKEMKYYKRKLKKKNISSREASDLRRKLNEWKNKGYYQTTSIQKKLDKFEKRDPLK